MTEVSIIYDSMTAGMRKIADRVFAGERIGREDAVCLMKSGDILALGFMADFVRRQKVGDSAFYSSNINITYTNACVNRCRFCAFSRDQEDADAYALDLEEVWQKIKSPHIREVHIVGGLHPELPLEYYEEMLSGIKKQRPDIFIQAFTAVEIDHFSRKFGVFVEEILRRLKDKGLGALPGGGAEVFSPRIRESLCEDKTSPSRWLEIMEIAHGIGLFSNATMLYGHIETPEERVDHLLKLRDLQDKTGGFQAFVPLAFHSDNTGMGKFPPTTGFDDLRVLAVSRIILDNFPHIKALWMYLGIKMAQVSLCFGVDDLGGTCVEEEIVHAAGAKEPTGISRKEIERNIREAGRIPVQANSAYEEGTV